MQLQNLYQKSKKAAMVFRALNNSLRQRILNFVCDNAGTTVTAIYVKLKLEQSVTSQHLGILRRAGIVTTERNGKAIHYKANEKRLRVIEGLADKLIEV